MNNQKDNKEIERSWLLTNLPPKELITHSIFHNIYYILNNKKGEMRVVERFLPDETKYSITIKDRGTLSRQEYEDDNLPGWCFQFLVNEAQYSLSKTRYFVDYNNYKLEIDKYYARYVLDKDFGCYYDYDVLDKLKLECEFSSEQEADNFNLPDWCSNAVETTYKSGYKNSYIAKFGWPKYE